MKQLLQSKLTVLTLTVAAVAITAIAPMAHAEEAKSKQTPAWLQKELEKVTAVVTDLNDEQKAKLVDAIKVRTEAIAKAKGGGASEEEAKAKTKDAWSAYTHEVKTFLSDAQFEKFKEANKPKVSAPKK